MEGGFSGGLSPPEPEWSPDVGGWEEEAPGGAGGAGGGELEEPEDWVEAWPFEGWLDFLPVPLFHIQ